MLEEEIKKRMFSAMKAKRTVEKEIMRVALGEIQTEAMRTGKGGDAEAAAIVKKLVKSNQETLALSQDAAQKSQLEEEIAILRTLLPESLSEEQIAEALGPVAEQIRAAKNDGQATGVAMKHLKSSGAQVDGKDVAAAVQKLRS